MRQFNTRHNLRYTKQSPVSLGCSWMHYSASR